MVIQVSCTVPIAKNLFRGQPFEGINFSEWKGNANIPLLAVPRILTTIPPTVSSHTCMVSTGCPFFFCVIFSLLYMLAQIVVFRQTMADYPKTESGVLFQKNDDLFGRIAVDPPHCIL